MKDFEESIEKVEELIKRYPFDLYEFLGNSLLDFSITIENTEVYERIKKLESILLPTTRLRDVTTCDYLIFPIKEKEDKNLFYSE